MSATAILHIDASPIAALARRLAEVDADRREPLEAIGAAWESSTKARFETGTAPDGSPWKKSDRARRDGGQTLVLTGRLKGSITNKVDGDAVEVGTNIVYAAAHQFGSQRAGARAVPLHLPAGADPTAGLVILPARPFIGIADDDYVTFAEILEGFVEAKAEAAGAT